MEAGAEQLNEGWRARPALRLQGLNSPTWSNRGGWTQELQRLLLPGSRKTFDVYGFQEGRRRFKIVCTGSVRRSDGSVSGNGGAYPESQTLGRLE